MTEAGETLLHTPLYDAHLRAGAKMVPFAGFEMPVLYAGVMDEHKATRSAAGLFDISHMGEFEVQGSGAEAFLQGLLTNNVEKLEVGKVLYSAMCRESGGIVDDLTLYRLAPERFLAVVNASNIEKDWEWMSAHKREGVEFRNISTDTALIAPQGPAAPEILAKLIPGGGVLEEIGYYTAAEREVAGCRVLVSRTGYTGEDGFELYLASADAPAVWDALLEAGEPLGLVLAGLGTRDTLRTEMKFALYGNDIDEETNPIEAGLGWVVKFKAGDFVGRERLLEIKEQGLSRKLVGLEMVDRGIPRHGAPILLGGEPAGVVTSGTMSPSLGKAIGIGYVPISHAEVGSDVEVDIRGKARAAKVVKTPFYRKK
ncbi:MAG: glycine cleavage system aminomethyltransferase GcvT [Nitrospinaceae bacterium]|jgi:aminomethyltransferase|nr:glycine cleavage system aminomethyltransferase GcvT [Nitrospinaceae bacterium]MBT4429715.1 glycine cleavage system aminomethyltransferase GcvT [Nitrospinaceae bacterium]MBT5367456.1 glycine cleavage system aminomethyltransferase GcvT [Nitrospinaceae bacterium]MBT5946691.1 glycine cleavage system aminomethyltransferase GcvT [Nitrospinaceae bacterium]MBT6396209.1 glycine cleavage system aminomethyltransferase GcvT [Nitrospinaceae bacterium]